MDLFNDRNINEKMSIVKILLELVRDINGYISFKK